ncbi:MULTISPECIES: 3-keto-5-aminohexanoate cleavage protein [unclassified Mesorhizobium]|uniref:3-keto-5-aminohexanoate cleavage protein n=1 Tax=unclassified Mesorhizobium TaxID=325217 RepID=UPI000BAFFA51|nr:MULTISPECIES: 3-keto-5-aminohexanoate cleavage protein [unclassified Mesorhizobium]TGT61082.1 3-keto-5-aminohexanoate cleavage protein [Mesorhizobium sp. M00.F.Ca.ET.170.01.1.1]AZO08852.1 3-keto-5-aminohexanoate cleavage protein [Mesorhizobium sp. M3A.F.Ca.ET.080.04.2.1]PBB84285.1 3-keto-5-aminohexanoate cleavage enzyme [Mesorhizobium sp. WSM3876]RWB67448.1 MAG: 3-keto-5-aminohexanoate cleavage protein [Mesorhizobium sp.]RWB84680.1 MAG: 3-keto-5-aminohexanoate cleavage protein [Mesorhizobiu
MIVQACINGARPADFHPALPLDAHAMAQEGAASVAAGAAELHVHARGADRQESLQPEAMDRTVAALRHACPGTLIGVSTGAWIEKDDRRTLAAIAGWQELPDYASVNLGEAAAPEVMEALRGRGIGIEAGLASIGDALRLASLDHGGRVLRVLIEISEQPAEDAFAVADSIQKVLERAGIHRSILLHGENATVWPFVERAASRKFSTRVGLEDGKELPDGSVADGNAALVAAAVGIYRSR